MVREFDALAWLQDHGFAGPTPLVALVWRRLGFVVRATLVTTAWPGTQADLVLAASAAPERNAVAESIGTLVGTLHALGFRDRNLDLRNLLVHGTPNGWVTAKIDSPRWQLRPAGRRDDALVRADWARLSPQLAAYGVEAIARAAALRVPAD